MYLMYDAVLSSMSRPGFQGESSVAVLWTCVVSFICCICFVIVCSLYLLWASVRMPVHANYISANEFYVY